MSAAEDAGLVFVSDPEERPALELRVNFGIFAGRVATPAEIDRLAEALRDLADPVTIVSEERHEIGAGSEAAVHQVRVDLPGPVPTDPRERAAFERRLLERAAAWARACIADRPGLSVGL